MAAIKIIIADDSVIIRKGLTSMFDDHTNIEVVGTAADGIELLELAEKTEVDVVLMDVRMPRLSGVFAAGRLRTMKPHVRVIVLSAYMDSESMRLMHAANATGFADKDILMHELTEAIEKVHRGEDYYCPKSWKVFKKVVIELERGMVVKAEDFCWQELKIIQLSAQEYSGKQIADEMKISVQAVDKYKRRICDKMRVKGTPGMVLCAVRNGLV